MPEPFGWFDSHNREMLEKLIKRHQVKTVLEIGSFLGCSTAWFAHRVEHVTCIDRWIEEETVATNNNLVATLRDLPCPPDFFQVFLDNMKREGVSEKVTTIRSRSSNREAARLAPLVDLVYIDADHSYGGCLSDIRLYAPKARKVICGDDYVWLDSGKERDGYGVRRAVTEVFPAHQSSGPFWWSDIC